MNKPFNWMTLVFLASVLSCDDGSGGSATSATSTDCLIGMFKPEGLADCVFPAERDLGDPVTVSDNRCARGQPAFPPSCVSDTGRRPYLSASHTCAPNYHFEPGVCQRGADTGGTTGTGGFFTGFAGTTGTAGFFGAAGSTETGGFFGGAGSTNTGGFTGITGGVTGSTGESGATGAGGETGTGGCTGVCSDASADI